MTRFAGALACLLATASAAAAMHIPASLRDVVNAQTPRNPALRKKDMERKNLMQKQLASMAVNPKQLDRRQLNDNNNNNNQQNNNQANYADYVWDEYMDEYALGFDITSYSIKYTQCATVQTYSDTLAEDEDSDTVLAAERFAIFRLCPADVCSDTSASGCASNYGEYIVSLDQFLLAMLEYQESRVAGYCEYCQDCAAVESAKSFWTQVYNTRDYALVNAKSSYTSWYTAFLENYSFNQNYNNGDNADGYENANQNQNMDSNMLAQKYYQQIRNSNNWANNYASSNYAYSNSNSNSNQNANYNGYNQYGQGYGNNAMNSQYRWYNQNMWNVQSSSQVQSSNAASWQSMGSPSGTFYGKQIMNGYYDGDGVFTQEYGYFNYQGEYVSLEEDELQWDEELWGEMPELWDGVTSDTESCSYQYAGTCYNQYESCMQILQDQEYQEYQQYQQAQQNGGGAYYGQGQEMQARLVLKDFLSCIEVDPQAASAGTDYANYQYASQNGGGNQYSQNNNYYNYNYDCGGNEYCEQKRQYQEQEYQYNRNKYENRRYFIGPHCGSDNKAISLAVYKDETCSVLDEQSSVASVLGYTVENDQISLFPSECMKCLNDGTSAPWYEDEEVYALEPMCSMLYQFSGKCNKNLQAQEYAAGYEGADAANNRRALEEAAEAEADEAVDEEWKQMYQSEQQAANEEAVCAFITSLTSNTYNMYGEVVTNGTNIWANPVAGLYEETRAMNKGLLGALVVAAIAVVAMSISVCVLHGALARKNIPWKPRRSKGSDPTELARQSSGITMGRSQSGLGNNNPLL